MRSRSRITPPTAVDDTIRSMGAKPPTIDDVAAIKAIVRGTADPGQQRRAITYILQQLCGVGRISFAGEGTNTTAFRLGAQAVGVAVAQIGDAVMLRFPTEQELVNEVSLDGAERGAGG